ncbi:MAG: LPS export ABC transporter periplasmic protein LptC [Bacteroidales bacterium]
MGNKIIFFHAILLIIILLSCSNDIEKVQIITKKQELPDISAKNISFLYSDSARLVISLKAKEFKRFVFSEKPYTEFPQGVEFVFFSKFPDTNSMIRANYAIQWINERYWEAHGNVIAKNENNEILNTEYLVWDEKAQKIHSDKFVKITTATDVIIGDGFEADQSFKYWKIKKVRGFLNISDNSENKDSTKLELNKTP